MGKLTELTEKERRFVFAFLGEAAGNACKAAELAGYKKGAGLAVTASRLLRKAHIQAHLANTRDRATVATVADLAERREMLSELMRTDRSGLVRINAANVLNKMDGVYVQKHQVSVTRSLEDLVAPSEARP